MEGRKAPKIMGIDYSESTKTPSETLKLLADVIEKNPNLNSLGQFENQDLKIGLVFFGNPKIGSPLMKENQRVGIDLPQRMLSYTNGKGGSYLAYNSAEYLGNAYGLTGNESLKKIEKALPALNVMVTNGELKTTKGAGFGDHKGIRKMASNKSFRETYQLILEEVSNNGYEIVLEVDHGENARKNGIDLRNTRLIVIEDPELSPMVDETNHTLFLDLWPLKFLVWEDEKGKVWVDYHNINFHFERRKLKTNSRPVIELKRMQTAILSGVKKGRDALPSQDLPS